MKALLDGLNLQVYLLRTNEHHLYSVETAIKHDSAQVTHFRTYIEKHDGVVE